MVKVYVNYGRLSKLGLLFVLSQIEILKKDSC